MKRITVREACRRRMPLDGADAQALEHALTITERERDAALADLTTLRRWQQEAAAALIAHCADEGCAAFPADCSGPEDTGIMASRCDIARLLREVPDA